VVKVKSTEGWATPNELYSMNELPKWYEPVDEIFDEETTKMKQRKRNGTIVVVREEGRAERRGAVWVDWQKIR